MYSCPDCNIELILPDYTNDPVLRICPKCEDEFTIE